MVRKSYVSAIFLILGIVFADAQIYVSPDGNDENPGTKKQPLATLTGARNALRKLSKAGSTESEMTVIVKDGWYRMDEPLVLGPEDSGTDRASVKFTAAKRARPVFSGGKKISGFKVNADGIWEIKIPECENGGLRFDQLYVNGKRAVLARTPNKGFLKINDIKQNIIVRGEGRVADKAQQILYFDSENFATLKNVPEDELNLLRFRAYHKWDFTIRYLDKIDKQEMAVYTTGKGMKPWNPLKKGGRIVFENYKEALDAPGEWFLNNDGVLFYYPQSGETPENTEVVIPVIENIITIKGDASNNDYVKNITFKGLTFTHCNYRMPETGFEPNQAAASVSAAVHITGAKNINFIDCEVTRTGQHAVWFGKGCTECNVSHCFLNDLGGGGIYLGELEPLKGAEHTSHIVIDNNIIHSGGREFPPAVGVWVGHSSDNIVSHNDIGNFYYTGISAGWIWGYAPSPAKRNLITYNNVHHIGWALLSDMAAVYTLGKSEGTKINNNVIHHVHAYSYGGWGLYTDEGSSFIEMKNNLVYSTKTGGFHQHYGEDNVIRNNIFAYAKQYQLQCTRVEDHLSFTLDNNIVIFDQGVVLKGVWEKIKIKMDNNLYWNTKGDDYDFAGKSFSEWKKTGHDTHSVIADPGFKDPGKYNFKLKGNDNTNKIGFVPFDYSRAGVYGRKRWVKKALLPESVTKEFDRVVEENLKQNTGRD